MDRRRLETIILIILALLNVFLLSVVFSDSAEARRNAAETVASARLLLEENGITVADGAIRLQSAPAPCTLVRDMQKEGERLRRIIGDFSQEDEGGNIFFYRGEKGQALLRGSGEIDVVLTNSTIPLRGGQARTAQKTLRRMGVAALPVREDGEDFYCTLEGVPVYNAVLHIDYTGSSLLAISGTWLFDPSGKNTEGAGMDSVSVLLRFVEIVRSEGYICSRLDSVQPGYLMTVTRSGEAELAPVWRIETDAGPLMIDAETGRLRLD